MALEPTILNRVEADGVGGLNITMTAPPVSVTYTRTQVWYRKLNADDDPWSDGGNTFIGTPGVPGVYNLPALPVGYYYQVICQAWHGAPFNAYSEASTPKVAAVLLAADPVIERITADAAATLATITQGNGYHHNVKEVHRVKTAGQITPALYPAAVVWAYDANAEDGQPVEHVSNTLNLVVEAWVKAGTMDIDPAPGSGGIDVELNWMLADITRAMLTDPRRAGNAIRTKHQRWVKFMADEGTPYGVIQITFSVLYRHQRVNPAVPV